MPCHVLIAVYKTQNASFRPKSFGLNFGVYNLPHTNTSLQTYFAAELRRELVITIRQQGRKVGVWSDTNYMFQHRREYQPVRLVLFTFLCFLIGTLCWRIKNRMKIWYMTYELGGNKGKTQSLSEVQICPSGVASI